MVSLTKFTREDKCAPYIAEIVTEDDRYALTHEDALELYTRLSELLVGACAPEDDSNLKARILKWEERQFNLEAEVSRLRDRVFKLENLHDKHS